MDWVERLRSGLGWTAEPASFAWSDVHSRIEVELPEDYRHLCEGFPVSGAFSGVIELLLPTIGDNSIAGRHLSLQKRASINPRILRRFESYGVLGVNGAQTGLLRWGSSSVVECDFFWNANSAVDPATWTVVSRMDPTEPFVEWGMGVSEFIAHAVFDPEFGAFGGYDKFGPPEFVRYEE